MLNDVDLYANKKDNLLFSKQKEISNELYNERFDRKNRLSQEIDFKDLYCGYKTSNHTIKFDDLRRPKNLYDQTKNSEITLEFAKDSEKKSKIVKKKFAAFLKSLQGGNKNEEQRGTLDNLAKFYKDREDIIDLFDDSTTMASEARYKAIKKTKGKGIKILPPKQMLQRLSIALGQAKAGDTSDNLLNQKNCLFLV